MEVGLTGGVLTISPRHVTVEVGLTGGVHAGGPPASPASSTPDGVHEAASEGAHAGGDRKT